MEITRHLNDEELAELLAETRIAGQAEASNDGLEHDPLQRLLRALSGTLLAATDRPEMFWHRQQAAIRSRIVTEGVYKPSIWAILVPTAVALTILAVLLLRPTPLAPVRQVQIDSDDELLAAVEQALETEVPYALAPASLLSEDTTPESSIQYSLKENSNAN